MLKFLAATSVICLGFAALGWVSDVLIPRLERKWKVRFKW